MLIAFLLSTDMVAASVHFDGEVVSFWNCVDRNYSEYPQRVQASNEPQSWPEAWGGLARVAPQ